MTGIQCGNAHPVLDSQVHYRSDAYGGGLPRVNEKDSASTSDARGAVAVDGSARSETAAAVGVRTSGDGARVQLPLGASSIDRARSARRSCGFGRRRRC